MLYVAGLLVEADVAILLDALAHCEVGHHVTRHQDGDPDVRPQLRAKRLVEPYHRAFARLYVQLVPSCQGTQITKFPLARMDPWFHRPSSTIKWFGERAG